MSYKLQYIEWSVPLSQVQVGVPIGYEVELSQNYNFVPVSYALTTYRENDGSIAGTFFYSLDEGVTWTGFPIGDAGHAFTSAYKMRLVINASETGYIFADKGGIIYKITPDGKETIDEYTVGSFNASGLEIDNLNNLYVTGQNQTCYKIDTFSDLEPGDNSINLHTDPLGIALDAPRNVLWQIDRYQVILKDLNGDTIFIRNLPVEIDVDWSSSSSSTSSSNSSSSSTEIRSSSSSSSTEIRSSSSTEIRSSSSTSTSWIL